MVETFAFDENVNQSGSNQIHLKISVKIKYLLFNKCVSEAMLGFFLKK